MTTSQAPLAIHDIIEPSPIAWFPPSIGWWLLLVIIILFVTIMALRHRRNKQRRAPMLEALSTLKVIEQLELSPQELLTQLNMLLKRVAKTYFTNSYDPQLHGHAWLLWLEQSVQLSAGSFTEGDAKVLGESAYSPKPQYDREKVIQITRQFIEKSYTSAQRQTARKNHAGI